MTARAIEVATIDAIRVDMAMDFELLADQVLQETALAAVVDHGGTHIETPNHGWTMGHEITLLGVTGTGTTLAEAMRQWTKCVLRAHVATLADAQQVTA